LLDTIQALLSATTLRPARAQTNIYRTACSEKCTRAIDTEIARLVAMAQDLLHDGK